MNKFLIALLPLFAVAAVSCSDDEPKIPADAISLNMMAGDSETTIGGSDVYVNASNNFTSFNCGIADLGKKGGLNQNPTLSQIAQEAAVTPGNFYQIFLAGNVRTVAGVRSLPINHNYYNVYVESWIYDNDKGIAGAKIRYAECYPDVRQLPDWDSEVDVTPVSDNYYYTASYSFSKGCVIDKNVDAYLTNGYQDMTDKLKIEVNDNKIEVGYPYMSSHTPDIRLYVRYDNVYTRVSLDFD
ncbi:MAG: DUF5036 family protein [Muribaculaceae bacterium]